MSNNSVIEHRACYHFIKVEEDYIAISSNGKRSPHCKALILAILEGWTNEKGRDVYIYMSLPQWTRATYMLYERNVITDCLQELLEEQLINRRPIIMHDQKTFEYKLNIATVQALIKELPEKESKNLPNLDNYLAFKQRNKAEKKKGVVEKSHTPKKASEKSHRVVEKSHTPIEKSTTVSEKSTGGYVKNQRNLDNNLDSYLDNNLDCSNVATAHADVDATSHTISLLEKNEAKENPTPEPTTEQGVTPPTKKEIAPRRSPATKKNNRSKKNATADLLALSEIPAPQKPNPDTQGYNVELFMKLADYYRGCELAANNNPNSNYQKALNAAMALVQRKAPFERVDKLFCFMLGRGEEIGQPKLRDKKWIDGGYHTDIWVVANHYTDKWLECQRLEQVLNGIAPNSKQSKSSGISMSHDEAQEVARDAIEKGKQHGYSIKAQAVCEKGVWVVKIDWDGDPLTMRSPAEWVKTFNYNYEEDQKELMKGAK